AGEAAAIASALIAAGKPRATPVAIVENASLENSAALYGTLEELPRLAEKLHGGPALILLGEVIRGQGRNYSAVARELAFLK
ncbi:MAG TPA: uroporphyrinogen-III C-methyltransferase, partial [Burkholderiales bacterium]|nr:uroporphyrinogen-III C-methyltransferase [Burkholderiales bacterium]